MPWDRHDHAALDDQIAFTPDPVFAVDRHFDVVGVNDLAAALSRCFTVGKNLVTCVYLDQRVRDGLADWEHLAEMTWAALRDEARKHPVDDRYVGVVGKLMALSPLFVSLWVTATRSAPSTGTVAFTRAVLGPLTLRFVRLRRPADDCTLIM